MTKKNRKVISPFVIVLALIASFGGSFAVATIQSNTAMESSVQAMSSEVSGAEEHTEGDVGDLHEETASPEIVTDSSVANASPDEIIDLLADGATPTEAYLEVGQVLQFSTKDGQKHKIALGEGGEEHEHTSTTNSGDFGADEAWKVRFDEVGTYFFHDHHNPEINVLVVVYEPDGN